jgi:hypothetical protein
MPTRIVLRETEAPSELSPRKKSFGTTGLTCDEEAAIQIVASSMASPGISQSLRASSSRRIVGFRGSIIREIKPEEAEARFESKLSKTDIRASPRLVGYAFQLLASSVMLLSVIQFYRAQENNDLVNLFDKGDGEKWDRRGIYASVNGPVYYWKLLGCVGVGCFGAAIYLFVLLVHFDTVCLPKLWFHFFRDGSRWEKYLLRLMLLFWLAGLYINTTSLSVGEAQANVYFTTWISFGSAVLNCGVWRVSAGLPSLAEKICFHRRETTYNWMWTLFSSAVFAASVTDVYFNRDEVTIRIRGGGVSDIERLAWIQVMVVNWGLVCVCIGALLLNHYLTRSLELKLWGENRFILGWRQIEGIVLLGMVGAFFWFIYIYTGVDGAINGASNAYYSLWASFFNAVFALGTWLRENKGIEYIVRDDGNDHRPTRR